MFFLIFLLALRFSIGQFSINYVSNFSFIWYFIQVESGKIVLEVAEFNLEQELEGLVDMFSVQCINHKVEIFLDLSGIIKLFVTIHFTAKELKNLLLCLWSLIIFHGIKLVYFLFKQLESMYSYFSAADNVPKLIQGDSGRVVQIFANLISNSIKFTSCTFPLLLSQCNRKEYSYAITENKALHNRRMENTKSKTKSYIQILQ